MSNVVTCRIRSVGGDSVKGSKSSCGKACELYDES